MHVSRRTLLRQAALPVGALALFCASCVSAPPVCHEGEGVRVCAATSERAEEVAHVVEAHVAAVRAMLPGLEEDAIVEVWLQERPQVVWLFPFGDDVGAVTNSVTGRIHAADASPDLATDLAHEAVHALLGDAWEGLPPTLEEGLCDQVATRLVDDGAELRTDRLIRAMAAVRGPSVKLRLDTPGGGWSAEEVRVTYELPEDFDLLDTYSRDTAQVRPYLADDERAVWYGTAYVAAGRLLDRLGADGLLRTCAEASDLDDDAAAALFAERAGLGSDPAPWRDAIEDAFGPAERAALARRIGAVLVVEATNAVQRQQREGTLRERFAAARPRLQVGAPSSSILLLDVPELAELLPAE